MAAVLPSQVQTPEQTAFAQSATQEIQQALTRLSAKTQRFRCTGLCRLGVQQGDLEEDLLLPIRSVPFDTTIRLLEEGYVEPPRSKKMNVETMEFDMVRDEWDQDLPCDGRWSRWTCSRVRPSGLLLTSVVRVSSPGASSRTVILSAPLLHAGRRARDTDGGSERQAGHSG